MGGAAGKMMGSVCWGGGPLGFSGGLGLRALPPSEAAVPEACMSGGCVNTMPLVPHP